MDTTKRVGHYCAAKSCKNKQYRTKESFFRFPTDIVRARIWAINCSREDLLSNLKNLNKSHRLCGAHFENKMFLNDMKNRLQPAALPTIFPLSKESSFVVDHNYSVFIPSICDPDFSAIEEMSDNDNGDVKSSSPKQTPDPDVTNQRKKEPPHILQNVTLSSGDAMSSLQQTPDPEITNQKTREPPHIFQYVSLNGGYDQIPLTPLQINIPQSESDMIELPREQHSSISSTQTSQKLSAHSPRKEKLRKTIKSLQRENSEIRKKLEECEEQLLQSRTNILDSITIDEYKLLAQKFFPSQELENSINGQLSPIHSEKDEDTD